MKNSDYKMRKISDTRRYPEMAAAGLWSTTEDLGKLMIEIQLSIIGKSNKIISKKLIKNILSPLATDKEDYVGLGIFTDKKEEYFVHTGSNYKFRNKFIGSINGGKGAVFMANTDKNKDIKLVKKWISKNL